MKNPVVFDVECYPNFFLIMFKSGNKKMVFKRFNDKLTGDPRVVKTIMAKNNLVSFNGNNYDIPMISGYLLGFNNATLKALSDAIITTGLRPWQLRNFDPFLRGCQVRNHIDLIGPTPLKTSLKVYGCRLHAKRLQDLPLDPSTVVNDEQAALLERYCENDIDTTLDVFNALRPEIELRAKMSKRYGMDLRSKGDPQIAEAILRHEFKERGKFIERRENQAKSVKPFVYDLPSFIQLDDLAHLIPLVQSCTFEVTPTGKVNLPEALKTPIEFAGAKYKLGIGGIHSQEKKQIIEPRPDELLGELDVASMYPSIIIGQGLYPEHLGPEFIDIYTALFNERLSAKAKGDKTTADTLKIVLNSTYGKLGDQYSFLYSPKLLIQTTITGQLSLLMLIERLTRNGVRVVSANTDGVVCLFHKAVKPEVAKVCKAWTKATSYKLEWTPYRGLYSRDVNSYVAIKPDGAVKTKGDYERGSLRKGYAANVCNTAVIEHFKHGTELLDTIERETDITEFLTMRQVTGGAVWHGDALGKVVRWVYSTIGAPITYAKNGNKVAGSDGAYPMMDLCDELPKHLNRAVYLDIAQKKLKRITG